MYKKSHRSHLQSKLKSQFGSVGDIIQVIAIIKSLYPDEESQKKIKELFDSAKKTYDNMRDRSGVDDSDTFPQENKNCSGKNTSVAAPFENKEERVEDDGSDGDNCSCDTAIQVVMLPHQTNQFGTIFGGIILSYIDQAAFVEASKHGVHRWVTASVDKVDFKKPIYVGDIVRFSTRTIKTGTKSVTIEVVVEAKRGDTHELFEVTHATVTMVSVGPDGRSIPFSSPPTAHYRGL